MPLEVVKLSKRSGSTWVFRDVEFTASEGRVFGICGPTACGKTTLLKTIAGLERSNDGSIQLDGSDVTRRPAKDDGIRMLAAAGPKGFLGLFGGKPKASTGEGQLAAFEQIIAAAGKVLLLDDPFAQLDERLRAECFATVRRAARSRDRIIIFASSDFDQMQRVADDMAVLAGGYVQQTGTPQDIYENPETVSSALISGDNNLFAARRLTSTDADLPEFHTIEGGHRLFAQAAEKSRLGAINQNVTLAIRPEQVSMSVGSSFPEDNLLRAVVTGIKFRGPTSLVEFDAAGLKIGARVFRIVGLEIGSECMLGLPPHRILVLKD